MVCVRVRFMHVGLYGFHWWKKIFLGGNITWLILYVPPQIKKLAARKYDRVFTKRQVFVKKAKQVQVNIWTGTSNTVYNNLTKLFFQRDVSRMDCVMYSSKKLCHKNWLRYAMEFLSKRAIGYNTLIIKVLLLFVHCDFYLTKAENPALSFP